MFSAELTAVSTRQISNGRKDTSAETERTTTVSTNGEPLRQENLEAASERTRPTRAHVLK